MFSNVSSYLLPQRSKAIPGLDGARGLAVLLVVANHAARSCAYPLDWVAPTYLPSGHFGVSIFFVISGFIITKLLLLEESRNDTVSISGFYYRRAFRILPALYFYLILVAQLDVTSVIPDQRHTSYLAAATFTNPLLFSVEWVFSHTWSLAVEEFFYLTFPFIFLTKKYRFKVCLFLLLCGPILRVMNYTNESLEIGYTIFTEGDAIMIGCIVAFLEDPIGRVLQTFSQFQLSISAITSLALAYSVELLQKKFLLGFFTLPFGVTAKAICIGIFLICIVRTREGAIWRILNNRLIVGIGVTSYSIYLIQQILFYHGPGEVPFLLKCPWNIVILYPTALVMYHAIETPFICLAKKRAKQT